MNCDYIININGTKLYIEIAGIICNKKVITTKLSAVSSFYTWSMKRGDALNIILLTKNLIE